MELRGKPGVFRNEGMASSPRKGRTRCGFESRRSGVMTGISFKFKLTTSPERCASIAGDKAAKGITWFNSMRGHK